MLKAVQERRVSRVVVIHEDRLARFGGDLLRQVFAAYGTTLEVMGPEPTETPEHELAQDLFAIATRSCRSTIVKYACVHGHYSMSTTTITLERSAYEVLKSRKRPGESFSEEVLRLLGKSQPHLKEFLTLFGPGDPRAIGDAIEEVRAEDIATERRRAGRSGAEHGHRS